MTNGFFRAFIRPPGSLISVITSIVFLLIFLFLVTAEPPEHRQTGEPEKSREKPDTAPPPIVKEKKQEEAKEEDVQETIEKLREKVGIDQPPDPDFKKK
jgi:hypothetical protein